MLEECSFCQQLGEFSAARRPARGARRERAATSAPISSFSGGGFAPRNRLWPQRPAEAQGAQPAPAGLPPDRAAEPDRGRSSPQVIAPAITVLFRPFRTAECSAERRSAASVQLA